jgi:hypothetical protein
VDLDRRGVHVAVPPSLLGVRPLLLRIVLIGVAGIGALVLAVFLWFNINASWDESRLSSVRATFQGLSRAEAYSRLRRMLLTPVGWTMQGDGSFVASRDAASHPVSWPARGDVAIDFAYAARTPPEGACGAHALAVLIFQDERIAKISEERNVLACP